MLNEEIQMRAVRLRFDASAAAQRVANFLNLSLSELKNFARLTGHSRTNDLSVDDLRTTNKEVSELTDIAHA